MGIDDQGPIKLVYFNLRGRAELPRLLLHAAGVKFEDVFDPEWKTTYEKDLKFGQVPLLKVGEKAIVQSNSIVRYLAKKCDLVGSTEDDQLLVDQLHEGTEDLYNALWPQCVKYRGGSEEKLKEALSDKGGIYKYLSQFEKICSKLSGPFFLGSKISYADLALYNVLTNTTAIDKEGYLAVHFPSVKRHLDAVEAHPNIKAYNEGGSRKPQFVPWTF